VTFDFIELPWLERPPANFSVLCRALRTGSGPFGQEAQRLAGFSLDSTQSGSVSRAIAKRLARRDDPQPLSRFKLGMLSSTTADILVDCLPAAAARHGVALEVVTSPYDQVMQQALDPTSALNTASLDAVLVNVDHRWLQLDRPHVGAGEVAVEAALDRLEVAVAGLSKNGGVPAILETIPVPPLPLFGSFERRVDGSTRDMIESFNCRLADFAAQTGAYILDTAALADRIGTDRWFDAVAWYAFKLPFSANAGPAYAEMLGRLVGAIRGKSRKCLVLDLDDTVWGGVIGDVGIAGIKIGQGSALGEAFLAVQHTALDLRERGIVLAVSSKNDDATARGPFRTHPDMALREQHISVFQANWTDKATNLEAIAKTLNIGLDALVFLDDNPAERAQLRAALPMVAIPELPTDPSLYARVLASAGYFEAIAFSDEDKQRAQSYASNAQRADVMAKSRDLGEYLCSLEMVVTVTPFGATDRPRISQLINKTNQFNLTTRRYSEAELAAFEDDPEIFTLQMRLADRFGEHGIIAVIIACADSIGGRTKDWRLDTWLMSCRVLGRRVEEATLRELVTEARAAGVDRLIGQYIPTAKNGIVADHYEKLRFGFAQETQSGLRVFVLDVANYEAPKLPISVVRSGLDEH